MPIILKRAADFGEGTKVRKKLCPDTVTRSTNIDRDANRLNRVGNDRHATMSVTLEQLERAQQLSDVMPENLQLFSEEEFMSCYKVNAFQQVTGVPNRNALFMNVTAVSYQAPKLRKTIMVAIPVEHVKRVDPLLRASQDMPGDLLRATGYDIGHEPTSEEKTDVYLGLAKMAALVLFKYSGEAEALRCFQCANTAISFKGFPIYKPHEDEAIFIDHLATPHCNREECIRAATLKVLMGSRKKIKGTDEVFCSGCRKGGARFQSCSKCDQARYCSKDCQVAHWRRQHRADCRLFRGKLA